MFKINQLALLSLIVVVIAVLVRDLNATEYPSPPPVPETFESPEEVQKYLNQLHKYYMVVGRPR